MYSVYYILHNIYIYYIYIICIYIYIYICFLGVRRPFPARRRCATPRIEAPASRAPSASLAKTA